MWTILIGMQLLAAGWSVAETSGLFVVTTGDFETGSTAFVPRGADDEAIVLDPLSPIHGDAVARFQDGRIFIIERFLGDNVIVLDPLDLTTPLVQFSVGNGSNPQDLEVAGPGKAFVSLYATSALLVVDPRDGSQLGEVDLSIFGDADGPPDIGQMARVGDRLYVAIQRLENFSPAGTSYVAVVDMATSTVVDIDSETDGVQGIELATTNPTELIALGNRLYVACVAGFGDRDGGIEIVDLASNQSQGVVISEADLDGDLTGMAVVSAERAYATVLGSDFVTHRIMAVDPSTGEVGAPLDGHSGGFTGSMTVDGDRLVVADFGSPEGAGLRIYEAASGAFLKGPISTGLPPVSVVVISETETAVEADGATELQPPLPQSVQLNHAFPNPFNASVVIPIRLTAETAHLTVDVIDALGRAVRTLEDRPLARGEYRLTWDATNEAGEMVGNGTYLIRLRSNTHLGEQVLSSKVLLVK